MANQENKTKESEGSFINLFKSKLQPDPFADLGCDIYVLPPRSDWREWLSELKACKVFFFG